MFLKRRSFLISIAIVVILIMLLVSFISYSRPRNQTQYKPFELSGDGWFAKRMPDYEGARNNLEDWTKNPTDIALYMAGYPNLDGTKPDKVSIFDTGSDRITVLVMENSLHDDSVQAIEVRVDLVKKNEVWEIEWAGGRWRCWRTLFSSRGTSLCP